MTRLRFPTVCREGWYYLVVMGFILGGAIMRQINLLMVLFGMMAGPLIFNAWCVSRMIRAAQVRRRLPEVVAAGDPLVVELEAECLKLRGGLWALVVEDRVVRVTSGELEAVLSPAVLFTHVPSGESRRSSYRGVLARRGRYRFGPLQVGTRFPLGLVARTASQGESAEQECREMLVLPRVGTLTHRWSQTRDEAYQRSRAQRRKHGPLEGDFHNLRPWRQGDTRRWIHWRTTARQGQLMVRQFEQHLQRDVAVLVDLWRPERAEQDAQDSVELAVSFAATVASEMCRRGGCELIVGIAGKKPIFMGGPASQALGSEIMSALAVAESDTVDHLPQLLTKCGEKIPAGTLVVLVSTRSVDLADTDKYAAAWNDSRSRAIVARILEIDASSGELQHYFVPQ